MFCKKLFISCSFLFLFYQYSSAQDSLTVANTTLGINDSLKAQKLLQTTITPSSEFWVKEQKKPHRYSANNTFISIMQIAYPIDPNKINPANIDSILSYIDRVIAQQTNEDVIAAFLYEGLSIAHQLGRKELSEQYYYLLTSEFPDSYYTSQIEAFAPDRKIRMGQTLPSFQIPSFQDTVETFEKKDFSGKYLLIDFWGTWCGPCLKEMPYLHEAFKKFKKESFTILSIALDDEYQTVKKFRGNKWPMPWNNSVIPQKGALDTSIRSKFEIDVIPKTLLVDQKGKIIATGLDLRGKKLIETLSSNIK